MAERYAEYFPQYIKQGVAAELLDDKLLQFDLARLGAALKPDRDLQFDYLGLQTLYDRYFLHIDEAPHRDAAGLLHARRDGPGAERDRPRGARDRVLRRAVELRLHVAARRRCSTAARGAAQLSSCYLTTVADDLDGIYEALKENALLSKFAGGLGNDWTRVRALGSYIKGTNGKSQGVVPFLKVVNDTAVAVNQGGKRKGAVCAYLETWHLDIEEFLELRKNTGDDRRRTHDMNTANWIPDLFMRRVDRRRRLDAVQPEHLPRPARQVRPRLRRRPTPPTKPRPTAARSSCSSACRRGTCGARCCRCCSRPAIPWITFKDACNVRSPQQHVGVVHSSNLCTEITLNTSDTEIAVCNLGSVNLAQHLNGPTAWRSTRPSSSARRPPRCACSTTSSTSTTTR